MPNIEIKAHYPNLSKARGIALRLKAAFVGYDRQVDTFYKVPNGRLKVRESSLKGGQLIPYLRPNVRGPKTSQYVVIPLPDVAKTKTILKELLGSVGRVEKSRELYLLGNVRIHLDRVKGLGNFLEFEAVFKKDTVLNRKIEIAKVEKLIKTFQIRPDALLKNSYRELAGK
jgi:predicted adenylyl cyclase CyaB